MHTSTRTYTLHPHRANVPHALTLRGDDRRQQGTSARQQPQSSRSLVPCCQLPAKSKRHCTRGAVAARRSLWHRHRRFFGDCTAARATPACTPRKQTGGCGPSPALEVRLIFPQEPHHTRPSKNGHNGNYAEQPVLASKRKSRPWDRARRAQKLRSVVPKAPGVRIIPRYVQHCVQRHRAAQIFPERTRPRFAPLAASLRWRAASAAGPPGLARYPLPHRARRPCGAVVPSYLPHAAGLPAGTPAAHRRVSRACARYTRALARIKNRRAPQQPSAPHPEKTPLVVP